MTKNQIDYQSYLESKRHNETYEGEVFRHNTAAEQLELSAQQISAQQAANSRAQANASLISANAAATNASANYLNAQTNQRAQNLKEEQWREPIVGGASGNAMNLLVQGANLVGKFIQLIH